MKRYDAHGDAQWTRRPERSNLTMMRLMTWISLRLGRNIARVFLYGIAAYFLLFSPASRHCSRNYLRVVSGKETNWIELFQHFMVFASTIHDRIYLINNRFDLFDISISGEELIAGLSDRAEGVFLLGAHMGSFEVVRAIGRKYSGMQIAMLMYEENARKLNTLLNAINPDMQQDVIALGRADSMLMVRDRLEAGALIGILADRTIADDTFMVLPFFGKPAAFPRGPFRLAAMLRRPLVFMVGLHQGGNRYAIHFEPLADFTDTLPVNQEAAITEAMANYVALVERHCRTSPYNWFNFFDFWQIPESSGITSDG